MKAIARQLPVIMCCKVCKRERVPCIYNGALRAATCVGCYLIFNVTNLFMRAWLGKLPPHLQKFVDTK